MVLKEENKSIALPFLSFPSPPLRFPSIALKPFAHMCCAARALDISKVLYNIFYLTVSHYARLFGSILN